MKNVPVKLNAECGLVAVTRLDGKVVHSGPATADALLASALAGPLKPDHAMEALVALGSLQATGDSARSGNFRENREDKAVTDLSSGSRIVLRLLAIRNLRGGDLEPEALARLDEMVGGFDVWVASALARRSHFVPSRYLGDLACGWLSAEIANRSDKSRLEEALFAMARYCESRHWGNGDHLAERPARRCIEAISALLILAESLPEELRRDWSRLLDGIVAIDDAFGAGPRVPAIAFEAGEPPRARSLRDRISGADGSAGMLLFLKNAEWERSLSPAVKIAPTLSVPCFGGIEAHATFERGMRMGSLRKFPLIESSERETSGLAWRSHPVCVRRDEGDTGFFQWEATEGKSTILHPTTEIGGEAHALTVSVSPPVVGRTFAIQNGSDAIVLRVLPAIAASWDRIVDRFRVEDLHGEATVETLRGRFQLQLAHGKAKIFVSSFELPGMPAPTLALDGKGTVRWDLSYDRAMLGKRRIVVHIWAISLGKGGVWLPAIVPMPDHDVPRRPEEEAYDFRWKSPTRNWHLLIDPIGDVPLVQV